MHDACNAKQAAGFPCSADSLKQRLTPGHEGKDDVLSAGELEGDRRAHHVKCHDKELQAESNLFFSTALDDQQSTAPVFIEACAGCGILSQTVKARGFKVLPIDCARNRHQPRCKIFELDLSQPHAIELLKRVCRDVRVICVHIALPCGTCSKARGIPLPDGRPGPPPLRDWGFLYGLPGLSKLDAQKVEAANQLYQAIAGLIEFLEESQIPWTVENP